MWQWVFNWATLDTGEVVTHELVQRIVEEKYAALREQVGVETFDAGH